jgi:hypothetical protein
LAGCVGDERDFIRVQCLQSLVSAIQTEAARVGYVGTAPSTANLGTPTNPKIAVVPGDFSLPPGNYGGILVVTGNMTMQGNAAYTGLILVIGNGTVVRNGGGAARLCGGMLVADVIDNGELNDPGDQYISSGWVGAPDYRHNGGGTTEGGICKDAGGGDLTQWSLPLTRLAFQQLR